MTTADGRPSPSNVGKARILHREAVEVRLRWLGAILLVLVVAAGAFLAVRYYGLREGWWTTLIPAKVVADVLHGAVGSVRGVVAHVLSWFKRDHPRPSGSGAAICH